MRYLPLFVLLCLSCSSQQRTQKTEIAKDTTQKIEPVHVQPAVFSPKKSDTIVISKKTAVFYSPDSIQIEKVKKEGNAEDFYAAADDNTFYLNTSHNFLDSVKLNIVEVENEQVLKFIKQDGSCVFIKKDTVEGLWGVYFFDPAKEPYNVDITNIQDEYKNYFKTP